MNYTASSVKRELDTKTNLTIRGGLGCPQDSTWTQENNTSCSGVPHQCSCTQAKTLSQKCTQKLYVCDKRGITLVTLKFYFTISQTNLEGFIDEHDLQLCLLIQNQSIDTAKFVTC